MKLWIGYGSEHSMNLVMIGHFKKVSDAEEAREIISQISEQVFKDLDSQQDSVSPGDRFSDAMLDLLKNEKLYSLSPEELEQFLNDVRVDVDRNKVVITTDEVDVSSFLKVLLDKGARVEVYSAHDYHDTGYGR